jgi:hypothetical protein
MARARASSGDIGLGPGAFIAGDIGRPIAGDIRPFGGPFMFGRGGGPRAPGGGGPRGGPAGRGFTGRAERHVLGATPCWERSRRMQRA